MYGFNKLSHINPSLTALSSIFKEGIENDPIEQF